MHCGRVQLGTRTPQQTIWHLPYLPEKLSMLCSFFARTTPQPSQNLVEPWWNPRGTLVGPWWNPRGTLPQGRPGHPRSLSGLRPQKLPAVGEEHEPISAKTAAPQAVSWAPHQFPEYVLTLDRSMASSSLKSPTGGSAL